MVSAKSTIDGLLTSLYEIIQDVDAWHGLYFDFPPLLSAFRSIETTLQKRSLSTERSRFYLLRSDEILENLTSQIDDLTENQANSDDPEDFELQEKFPDIEEISNFQINQSDAEDQELNLSEEEFFQDAILEENDD